MWLQQHVAARGRWWRWGQTWRKTPVAPRAASHPKPWRWSRRPKPRPRPLRSQSQRSSRQRSSRLGTEVWWHGATRKKGTVGEGKGKPCRKMISAVYKHFYDSTILVAECPCLCQFSGDKSYCLPFVCQCLVPWAGWFRFCLPLVMLFVTHLFRLCWCLSAVLVLFATCWATKNFECWKALMSRIIKFSKESFLSFSWQIAGPADQFWLKPFPGK